VAVDAGGNVYVLEQDDGRIQVFTSDGSFITQWGATGVGDGQFDRPLGIALDNGGNVYIADTSNNRVQKFGQLATPALHKSWGQLKARYR
jgi:DNA-binding beta-propeller fold protein YncE